MSGRAGGELRAAGPVGRSQTDAGEAGHPAAGCQEHVQADGHAAQQDALLQCKIIFPWFISVCNFMLFALSFYILSSQN